MENDIKSRYIYAVVRHLPLERRADIRNELEAQISDMLRERCGESEPTKHDIEAVLTQLGSPEELALKYGKSGRTALISGVYYLMYKRTLLVALPIVASVVGVLYAMAALLDFSVPHTSFAIGFIDFGGILDVISSTISAVVHAFAVITVIFAVLDYAKVNIKGNGTKDLPDVPESVRRISPFWPIISIWLVIGLTVLFLGFPQVFRLLTDFEWIPLFDVTAVRALWLPILLFSALDICSSIAQLAERRYTLRLAAITLVLGVLQVILAVVVFGNDSILNPEFVAQVPYFFADLDIYALEILRDNVIARPHIVVMGGLIVVVFFEVLDVVIKAFQARCNSPHETP